MAFDGKLLTRPLSAVDFTAIGEHAEELVRFARELKSGEKDSNLSARRRYSQRDIAAATGFSPTLVSNFVKDRREAFGGAPDEEPAKGGGRPKRYTVSQYLSAIGELTKGQTPDRRELAATIVFANFKGGCAKSTTTATYAAGEALRNRRILVVDMDPQGTLSALFGIQPSLEISEEDTLLPYFLGLQPDARYAVKPTRLPTLHIIPASSVLSRADVEIPMRAKDGGYGRVKFFELLRVALAPLRDSYDLILIDSPPSLSYLTTMACYAADGLIIPLQPSLPDYASSATFFEQMGSFFGEMDSLAKQSKQYDFVRMVLTRHDGSRPHREMEQEIRNTYGGLVLGSVFIESNAIKVASNHHLTVHELDPTFAHRDTLARAVESAQALGANLNDLAATITTTARQAA